jgi:hypothetical protein
MSAEEPKLTGVWHGLYTYLSHAEPVYFVATIIAHGDHFSGLTHEAQVGRSGAPLALHASVEGTVDGNQVNFKKSYDGSGGWTHSLMYFGQLNGERTEIEGQWVFPTGWNGRFLMLRGERVSEAAIRRAFEKV